METKKVSMVGRIPNLLRYGSKKSMMHQVAHFAAVVLNNPLGIGILSVLLVTVPVIGMDLVHKYGWEHWAPFDRGHK